MGPRKNVHITWQTDDATFQLTPSALELGGGTKYTTLNLGTFGSYASPKVLWHLELCIRRDTGFGICTEALMKCHPQVEDTEDKEWKSVYGTFTMHFRQELGPKSKEVVLKANTRPICFKRDIACSSTAKGHYRPHTKIATFDVNPQVTKLHIKVVVKWRSDALQITNTLGGTDVPHDRKLVIRNLKALLISQKHCDVVFVVDGEEIPAHRAIMAAMSDVFSCMFEHDTEDKRTGRVNIEDASATAFKQMLSCMYTGFEPKWTTDEELLEICYLAHKYDLEPLQTQCTRRIVSTLRVNNACQMIRVAGVLNQPGIMDSIVDFIKENKDVLQTDEWEKLQEESPSMVLNILRKVV